MVAVEGARKNKAELSHDAALQANELKYFLTADFRKFSEDKKKFFFAKILQLFTFFQFIKKRLDLELKEYEQIKNLDNNDDNDTSKDDNFYPPQRSPHRHSKKT